MAYVPSKRGYTSQFFEGGDIAISTYIGFDCKIFRGCTALCTQFPQTLHLCGSAQPIPSPFCMDGPGNLKGTVQ